MTIAMSVHRRGRFLLAAAILALSLFSGLSVQRAVAQPAPIAIDALCASSYTGAVTYSPGGCPPRSQTIDLTAGEVIFCQNSYTGQLRYSPSGTCVGGALPLTLGGATQVTLCASSYTGSVRYSPTGVCVASELALLVEQAASSFDCVNDGDCPRPLPEVTDTSGSVTSFLAVNDPGGGQIIDVNVFVDFSHAYISDLDVFLESPNGTIVQLFTDIPCLDEGDLAVTLDDSAGSSITAIPCAAQMSGSFYPEGDLYDFNTETASGTWELQITDDTVDAAGLLWDWRLEITTNQGVLPEASCSDCIVLIPGTGTGGTAGVTVSQIVVNPPVGTQIDDLDLTLDISHTYLGDLHIYLQSPSGTVVKVFEQICDDDIHLAVIFDDEAVGGLNCANRLGFNSFQPAPGALAAVDSEDPSGTWLLVVLDDSYGDSGTLNNWILDFDLS